MLNRRQTLWALAGMGSAAAGGYGWIQRRGLIRADLVAEGASPLLAPGIREILGYALLAPSGHNAQPWTVRVGDGELRIGTDRARWLPKVDPANRELALSVGAFLENLLIAAPNYGYLADFAVIGANASADELLQVKMKATPIRFESLGKLAGRRTLRSGHMTRTLSGEDLKILTAAFKGDSAADSSAASNNEIHFFSPASREGRYLAQGTIEANRAQALRDDAQQELAEWIRWTSADGRAHRDGLTPESMEISGVPGWYVRHFMNRERVRSQSFRNQGVDRVREQVAACGGWFVITSRDSSLPSLIETGRRTERMWLAVRQQGIAIHPMTQLLEEKPFQDRVASTLGVTGDVQFILRAGYVARYPEPTSLRVPLSTILRA